ncbi:hypothetical protein [Nocardia sp. NPDC005825]|uniref:hypothetical protein n=1 Tax=unclassified Nocardia TaxID=2637762 RepID=UPI0033D47B48
MKIQIAGSTDNLTHAKGKLADLLREWDQELTEMPETGVDGSKGEDGRKTIDPYAITTLVLSIPSTALAVLDIADRISKRRRAQQLLQQAQELTQQGVTITLLTQNDTPDVATLTPDQLLDRNTDT